MIQTQENDEKPHSGPDLGPLGPNSSCEIFFAKSSFVSHWISWSAIIMDNIRKKLMVQS